MTALATTRTEPPPAPISRKARIRAERRLARKRQDAEKAESSHRPIVARNESQRRYLAALHHADQVFAVGSAGTGKTYLAVRYAAQLFKAGKIGALKFARPQASRERHRSGFLPGDLGKKLSPWFAPILDALREEFSQAQIDKLIQSGAIEFLSFEHMRGRTFRDCYVILDEAQNCDWFDLKLFLTRIGEDSRLTVCGDQSQSDVADSGLTRVVALIERERVTAEIIVFDENDVVRSGIAGEWVRAFAAEERAALCARGGQIP